MSMDTLSQQYSYPTHCIHEEAWFAPVTSTEAGGELETAAGLGARIAASVLILVPGWRLVGECCYCHEYAQRSGPQKLSERCRGGEGRLERGGAVGASGRCGCDGAAGQKERRQDCAIG